MKTNINIPYHIKELMKDFESNGYEIYVVGGCVRDSIIGLKPKDWDLTTNALPQQMIDMIENSNGKYGTLNNNGLEHGTVTFRYEHDNIEVTTFRIDTETDGRHSKVEFTSSLKEDLSRRDLTINAMAVNLNGELFDFFGGYQDLCENGITIKTVGKPLDRFNEDYLRMLRAIRFSTKFNRLYSDMDEDLGNALLEMGYKIRDEKISLERITDEFRKILSSCLYNLVEMLDNHVFVTFLFKDVMCLDISPKQNELLITYLNNYRSHLIATTECPFGAININTHLAFPQFMGLLLYICNTEDVQKYMNDYFRFSNDEKRDIKKTFDILTYNGEQIKTNNALDLIEMRHIYRIIGHIKNDCPFITMMCLQNSTLLEPRVIRARGKGLSSINYIAECTAKEYIFKHQINLSGDDIINNTFTIRGRLISEVLNNIDELICNKVMENERDELIEYCKWFEEEYQLNKYNSRHNTELANSITKVEDDYYERTYFHGPYHETRMEAVDIIRAYNVSLKYKKELKLVKEFRDSKYYDEKNERIYIDAAMLILRKNIKFKKDTMFSTVYNMFMTYGFAMTITLISNGIIEPMAIIPDSLLAKTK